MRDWEWLALTDHYHTAVAIREALREGDVEGSALSLLVLPRSMSSRITLASGCRG